MKTLSKSAVNEQGRSSARTKTYSQDMKSLIAWLLNFCKDLFQVLTEKLSFLARMRFKKLPSEDYFRELPETGTTNPLLLCSRTFKEFSKTILAIK
jgi:hypothetical protein